ncbi:DUF3786 domain-containing protein [Tepidibacter aestuarii]|uniref:DUF3786 domain-containing protein n=1 Tax=Tepidibacter aestuarii TaxID=2925782 RepID=UPI0020BE517E|nr:DUF3786 domain-containing protein [Tepidibacter aestuarii]CAH2214191.1 DUF3786 domain-containing protein [Tepidibacter aestuarii]
MSAIIQKDDRQGRVPYEYIKNIFKNTDPSQMAELTGNKYDENAQIFTVKLMGKNYTVKYPSGDIYNQDNKLVESYITRIMFLRYLVNGKGVPPTGKDITFKDIPGGHVYYHNFHNRTILRLANLYGNKVEDFEESFKNIDSEKIKQGDLGYKFEFLKNVFFTFIVWEGDEEFAPSASILFDSNIEYYFDAEDLAVVVDIAINFLKNKGELPVDIGLYSFN